MGARFRIDLLPTMGLMGIAYVVLRSLGKFTGVWLEGRLGGAEPAVRDNLGFGPLSQAGVAIGPIFINLAISRAGEIGQAKLGDEVWASEGTPQ